MFSRTLRWQRIHNEKYWRRYLLEGRCCTDNIQSDDFINFEAPGIMMGDLQLKSDGGIVFNNTTAININDDNTQFNADVTVKKNVKTDGLRSNFLYSDTISALNTQTHP